MGDLIHFPLTRSARRAEGGPAAQPAGSAARTDVSQVRERADVVHDVGGQVARPPLLWREAVGHELRTERLQQSRTLADVAGRAGISTQYLSEVERGRKEPSSEVLEAVGTALSLTLLDLTGRVAQGLSTGRATGPQLLAA